MVPLRISLPSALISLKTISDSSISIFPDEIKKLAKKCYDLILSPDCSSTFDAFNESVGSLRSSLKGRICELNREKQEVQKSVRKAVKLAINRLFDMKSEAETLFERVGEQFRLGKYDACVKTLEDSFLRYSESPMHKAKYYGELAHFYTNRLQCDKAQRMLAKQESYIAKIDEAVSEKKDLCGQLWINRLQLYQRKSWVGATGPYTSKTLEGDPNFAKIVADFTEWKSSLRPEDPAEKQLACRACMALGNCYAVCGKPEKAIRAYEEGLRAITEMRGSEWVTIDWQRYVELAIYIGASCQNLQPPAFDLALERYERAEEIARKHGNLHVVATCLVNKAVCWYRHLRKPVPPSTIDFIRDLYKEGIDIFSTLEMGRESIEDQVRFFDGHDVAYVSFENFLYDERRYDEALQIAQSRRARALRAFVEKKRSLPVTGTLEVKKMQELAESIGTTFVLYSLAPLLCKNAIRIWVVSATDVTSIEIEAPSLLMDVNKFSEDMKEIQGALRKNIRTALGKTPAGTDLPTIPIDDLIDLPEKMEEIKHSLEEGSEIFSELQKAVKNLKDALRRVNKQLEVWYGTLIPADLRKLVGENKSLTIIPERELAHVPFAALRDSTGKYLIENYSLSTAPSIHMRQVLRGFGETSSDNKEALVVYTNPKQNLAKAPEEKRKITSRFDSPPTVDTYDDFFKSVRGNRYDYIHLICHGTDTKTIDEDSIFKGALNFESKGEFGEIASRDVFGNDIAKQELDTELVFLSSCLSGKGKIYQEGNVGLTWAFLAAGARSVISCFWPLSDSDLTVKTVDQFYRFVQGIYVDSGISIGEALEKVIGEEVLKGRIGEKAFEEESKRRAVEEERTGGAVQRVSREKALQAVMRIALESNRERPDKWGLFVLSGLSCEVKLKPGDKPKSIDEGAIDPFSCM